MVGQTITPGNICSPVFFFRIALETISVSRASWANIIIIIIIIITIIIIIIIIIIINHYYFCLSSYIIYNKGLIQSSHYSNFLYILSFCNYLMICKKRLIIDKKYYHHYYYYYYYYFYYQIHVRFKFVWKSTQVVCFYMITYYYHYYYRYYILIIIIIRDKLFSLIV